MNKLIYQMSLVMLTLVITVVFGLGWAGTALAGSISGRVTNTAGEGIPGMLVSAFNDKFERSAGTDSEGYYIIGNLPSASYKVFFGVEYRHTLTGCYPVPAYMTEWYDDKKDYPSADLVSVIGDLDTGGVNAVLEPLALTTAQNLYVEPLGLCGGKTPCFSFIRSAIESAASSQQIVNVAQGTYHESLAFCGRGVHLDGGWNSSFTSRSQDPSKTIIDGRPFLSVVEAILAGGSFDGVTITGGDIGVNGINVYLEISNSIIAGNTHYGTSVSARDSGNWSHMNLTNCLLYGNGTGIAAYGALTLSDSATFVDIMNSTIAGNTSGGVLASGAKYILISNIFPNGLKMGVRNSVIWGDGGFDLEFPIFDHILQSTATVEVSFTDLGSVGGPWNYIDGGSNIKADPLFADALSGDFHLTHASPCIDAGTNEGAPLSDLEGHARPIDGNGDGVAVTDMGAYEYVNHSPVANAGPDQLVSANNACLAPVILDGTGSMDPDGDALAYSWTGPFGTLSGAIQTVSLTLGAHVISLTVNDGRGGVASDTLIVTVVDQTPPIIASIKAIPNVLWPPNSKMVDVTIKYSATDNCDQLV
jgi:Carboxypeptidase regulatory-like domain